MKTTRKVSLAAALLLPSGSFRALQAGAADPVKVSICEVSASPDEFAGQMVSIRGWVSRGKQLTLLDVAPSKGCHNDMLTIVLPKDVRPTPEFALQSDASFHQFEKALSERTRIEGTFQGRFERLNRGRKSMRLILQRALDLDVKPAGHMDR